MTTFSQLVDSIVSETKRPDLVSEISRYLNQTIRELHFTPDKNAIIYFAENLREVLLTANIESGFSWQIPNPTVFQKMQAVKYPNAFTRNWNERQWDLSTGEPQNGVYAKETVPGRHLNDLVHFYYRVGGNFMFSGYGGINSNIALAYYEFPISLLYKSVSARPASYDPEAGWTYPDSVDTPELQAAAQLLTTNWMLNRWEEIIAEGLRAKIYKRLADTERARTSYSMYGSMRMGMWTGEIAAA